MSRLLLLSVFFAVGFTNQVWAISNGGFETGDLTGWSNIQRGGVRGPSIPEHPGLRPSEGQFFALIANNGDFGNNGRGLENQLGVPIGTLATAFGKEVNGGSLTTQTFSASAGDIVSFDWRYLTQEKPTDIGNDDLAFLAYDGEVTLLANIFSDLNQVSPPIFFNYDSGWRSGSISIQTSGSHTLAFGAIDLAGPLDGDDTALLIDNVAVNPVPEPSTIFLLGSGLVGLAGWRWRNRQMG